jgi:hypothetical protein
MGIELESHIVCALNRNGRTESYKSEAKQTPRQHNVNHDIQFQRVPGRRIDQVAKEAVPVTLHQGIPSAAGGEKVQCE